MDNWLGIEGKVVVVTGGSSGIGASIINIHPVNGNIEPGMAVSFDGKSSYQITAVGNVVEKNLADLGHITLKFDGSEEPELPGTLYLEDAALPDLAVGTTLTIQ